jgi:hypothetical protein
MRISEVIVQKYCDFCSPERRQKAVASCAVCNSKDICDDHRNFVPVKRRPMSRPPSGMIGQDPTPYFMKYTLFPVCPDCSSQSFFDLVESLSRKIGHAIKDEAR